MLKYKVYGDYGYLSETLLNEFASLHEAIVWAEMYCSDGDFGGYDRIEVLWFHPSGECMIEEVFRSEDYYDETAWDNHIL